MENAIRLQADVQQIEVDITNPAWCECWLEDGANRIYLGADSFTYIQSHLLHALEGKPDKIAGASNGKQVYWILSLLEAYHTLYCAISGEDKILFWQDKHGNIISEIKLPTPLANQWIIQLKAMRYDTKGGL